MLDPDVIPVGAVFSVHATPFALVATTGALETVPTATKRDPVHVTELQTPPVKGAIGVVTAVQALEPDGQV
jgi:hypothetical protein